MASKKSRANGFFWVIKMFRISDYFVPGNAYGTYTQLVIMFLFMSLMVSIAGYLLIKTYFLLKRIRNDANKYLLRTMFGIFLWNLGEWILTITELSTHESWGIFSGLNNVPLATGLVLTVNSFFSYMQINLKINKYKQRRRLFNQKIFSVLRFSTGIALYLFILRYLGLPFMSQSGVDESFNLIIIIMVGLSLLVLILMSILFIQLLRERRVLSSKLDRIRVNFYLIFIIFMLLGLIMIWIFLLSYLFPELKQISELVIYLIYLPSIFALLFLYYGIFLPDWLQKRLGLLPSF